MSGTTFGLGALTSAALNLPETLIFGSGDPLVLGKVVFDGFEIPSQINFGGTQTIHIHRLPGGERVFDVMGRDEAPVLWSAILLGGQALSRAIELDVLRTRGDVLPLSWGTLTYKCVIKSFEADYQHKFHIPYKIACEILRDNSAPLPNDSVAPEEAVSNDVSTASDAVPATASKHVVTKTVVEKVGTPGATETMTYAPIGSNPSDLGLGEVGGLGDQAQAAGNNVGNSSLSLVDAGPPFAIPGGTDSLTAMNSAVLKSDLSTNLITGADFF